MQEPSSLRYAIATLLGRPDEVMLELGAGGELLVAKLRALLSLLALFLPLVAALGRISTAEMLIGLGAVVFINIMAQIWLVLARHHRRHRWLPYATGTYDITTTSGVLVLLALYDPAAGLNSIIVWCFYTFAIALTALRNDGRLTLYVGGLAIVQYGLLVAAILSFAPKPLLSIGYGTVTLAAQAERLLLLAMMTLLVSMIVYRMQRLIEMSGRDVLTRLPNRAWLLQRLPGMFDAARSDGRSLTLALIDLDHFKRVSEEIGYRDADRSIRHVAQYLQELLGEEEHLARIGGQEFVVVLQGPVGSAWERIDRARARLAERPFLPERHNDPVTITFSAGLAAFPPDGGDASTLLGSADRRLQLAKSSGRNRVIARDL